jgi:hypothetical protein
MLPLIFAHKEMNQKAIGCILMTDHGLADELLTGMITTFDLPLLAKYTFTDSE